MRRRGGEPPAVCFVPLLARCSGGRGCIFVWLLLLFSFAHFMERIVSGGGGEGIKIKDKSGFCPIKCRWGSDCGYDVPSMMNVLDLEELNGSPGDKRKM